MENSTSIFATKADVFSLKESMISEFGAVRREMAEQKADMLKWMFIYFLDRPDDRKYCFNPFVFKKITCMENLLMRVELEQTFSRLGRSIDKMEARIFRWMFFFFILNMASTFALFLLFLKK